MRARQLGKLRWIAGRRVSSNCVIVGLADQIAAMSGARRRPAANLIELPLHVMAGEASERQLAQLVSEFVARAGASGFTLQDVTEALLDRYPARGKRR